MSETGNFLVNAFTNPENRPCCGRSPNMCGNIKGGGIMSEQVESLLEGAHVLQVLVDKCGDEIYHLEIVTADGDTVHIYASGEGSLDMREVKNNA